MKMVPFHSLDGVIIGHVDLDMCHRTRYSVVIDDGPDGWLKVHSPSPGKEISPDDYVEMFHIPLREIRFQHNETREKVLHLVVDDTKLPKWFWDAKAIVAFTATWQPVSP